MTLLSQLHPPRLPADFAALHWPEVAAALALGALLALIVHAAIRPALVRRPKPRLDDLLAAMDPLPPDSRLIEELRLLRRLGGTAPDGLYAGPPPDLRPLIRAAWKGRGDV
ncbi:hypothetical protein [Falsirhodobacter xinxiangensis]|uniref:hypothetical protein n=1 Tax=Falsirhodobacter xinxiangensis TaxID=2530049 RepID=UPI0010AA368B|nr:hypothetical protein [Rhodobacter xinxiangensis]